MIAIERGDEQEIEAVVDKAFGLKANATVTRDSITIRRAGNLVYVAARVHAVFDAKRLPPEIAELLGE